MTPTQRRREYVSQWRQRQSSGEAWHDNNRPINGIKGIEERSGWPWWFHLFLWPVVIALILLTIGLLAERQDKKPIKETSLANEAKPAPAPATSGKRWSKPKSSKKGAVAKSTFRQRALMAKKRRDSEAKRLSEMSNKERLDEIRKTPEYKEKKRLGSLPPASEMDGTQRLFREIAKAGDDPCNTTLRLEKLLWSWYVSCPNCASIPAERHFPKILFDIAENYSVNREITFNELGRLTGECP